MGLAEASLRGKDQSVLFVDRVHRGGPQTYHPRISFDFILEKICHRKNGAGRGNRTLLASLEDWNFTTKLYPQWKEWVNMCGVRRFASSPILKFLEFVDENLRGGGFAGQRDRVVGEVNPSAVHDNLADVLRYDARFVCHSIGQDALNGHARDL